MYNEELPQADALERYGSGGDTRMAIAHALGLGEINALERRYAGGQESE